MNYDKENFVYIAPDVYSTHGFLAKVGGRTEDERIESRKRLEAQSEQRAAARTAAGIYIAERADGNQGMFAATEFTAGNPIIDIREGSKRDDSDIYTIEVEDGHYMHKFGRYTNHSCDPSAAVDKESGMLIADKDIKIDDEITFDYLTTEKELKADFDCNCGAENCVGKISGKLLNSS